MIVLRKQQKGFSRNKSIVYFKDENYNVGGNGYASNFYNSVVEVFQKEINFKNCYACRFLAHNSFEHLIGDSLFCKRKKIPIENSNVGYNCNKFWRIQ